MEATPTTSAPLYGRLLQQAQPSMRRIDGRLGGTQETRGPIAGTFGRCWPIAEHLLKQAAFGGNGMQKGSCALKRLSCTEHFLPLGSYLHRAVGSSPFEAPDLAKNLELSRVRDLAQARQERIFEVGTRGFLGFTSGYS